MAAKRRLHFNNLTMSFVKFNREFKWFGSNILEQRLTQLLHSDDNSM